MIDKKKELENIEAKYNEINKLNYEINSIITNIKNDVEINREDELLKEKLLLENSLKALEEKLHLKEKEIVEFKHTNAILLEELKHAKHKKLTNEINKFELLIAKTVDIELENSTLRKLNTCKYAIQNKISNLDKELSILFSQDANQLRDELATFTKKVNTFLDNSYSTIEKKKNELLEENSIFHNNVTEEIDTSKNESLFEKEKKKFVFEKLIGLKGFNFLGIISIFLGLFLVFKTQFKEILSNNYIKSSLSYLLGLLFLFIGEYLYKKGKKNFSVGLIGGGIGILYLTTLLSTMYLNLFPIITGLIISILLTGLVIALALRYDSQTIGILSLIGGYLPYGAYILVNKSNIQIYYILIYSLILQGTVLGISWKKDWMYNKIFGFFVGTINTIGLILYLNYKLHDKWTSFIYILIFTTTYSFILLNSHKKENRKINVTDYLFISLNLIIKFTLIYSLFDNTTPSWMKTTLVGIVGIVYGFFGDRLKENKIAKIFYIVSLISFILIIPLIVPVKFAVIAWCLETLLLYLLYTKYKAIELRYAAIIVYIVSIISNVFIRDSHYLLIYLQEIMVIILSFVIYFLLKNKNKYYIKLIRAIIKYCTFLYSIFFIHKIIYDISSQTNIYFDSIIIGIIITSIILRYVTYKIKDTQDSFSLKFLVIIECIYLLWTHTLNIFNDFIYYNHHSLSYIIPLILLNIIVFLFIRNDLHLILFKKIEKNHFWILGECIYILLTSKLILTHSLELNSAGLIINIIGLLMCVYLVWKGFRIPNRSIRRIGLGIGIFFVAKSFLWDFLQFENKYKLIAYFSMGIILIGTSYIYQTALKSLEKTNISNTNNDNEGDTNEN